MSLNCPRVAAVVSAIGVCLAVACERRDAPLVTIADNSPAAFVEDVRTFRPLVLHDEAAMAKYLADFPSSTYRLRATKGLGSFYIDTRDDVIKAFLDDGQGWESNISDLLKAHIVPGTTVLDIGAHVGTHTVTMGRAAGARGHVFAFEPQRKLFRELTQNLAVNQIGNATPLRFAVGEGEPRTVEMGVVPDGNEGGAGVGEGGDAVELRTIDSFGFKNVSLMKIDVEGYEDHVLEGAARTIAVQHPILLVEIIGGTDYDTAEPELRVRIDATKARMQKMGYTVTRVSIHDYLGVPVKK